MSSRALGEIWRERGGGPMVSHGAGSESSTWPISVGNREDRHDALVTTASAQAYW